MQLLPLHRIGSHASSNNLKTVIGPYYAAWTWRNGRFKLKTSAESGLRNAIGILIGILMLIRGLVRLGIRQRQVEIECIKGIEALLKTRKCELTQDVCTRILQLLKANGITVKWKEVEESSNVALSSGKFTNLILLPHYIDRPFQALDPCRLNQHPENSFISHYHYETWALIGFQKGQERQTEALERSNKSASASEVSKGTKILKEAAASGSSSKITIKIEEELEEVSNAGRDEGVEGESALSEREKSLKDREDRLKMAEERLKEEKREVKKRKLLLDLEELNKKVEQTQKKLKRLESRA